VNKRLQALAARTNRGIMGAVVLVAQASVVSLKRPRDEQLVKYDTDEKNGKKNSRPLEEEVSIRSHS
jgi:hypothetical protein